MGADFLRRCKAGVFQYVVVRLLLAVLTLFLSIIGLYEEGKYEYTSAYLWITGICCCSQSWALYSLFMFYHCSYKELITMRPFMKFLCLKMVIFFCWWQALAISVLVRLGHINSAHGHSVQEVADLIQDLLISMEMLVAAIAFLNSFPITEFATVRQLSWGKGNSTGGLSPSTAVNSTGTTGLSSYPGGMMTNSAIKNGPKIGAGGFPTPVGSGLLVETVACITGSLISNAGIVNQRTTQSPPRSILGDKTSLSVSDTSFDSSGSSPVSDDGKSPTISSSRKVFLPYAVPSRKVDITDKKVKMSKKDKIDLQSGKYSLENDEDGEVELKDKSKLKSENTLGLNFSSPLTILRDAGLFKYSYQTILPFYSFSSSSDNTDQKRMKKVKGNDVYDSLVTEGMGNAVVKKMENNKVNTSIREGGICEGGSKKADIGDNYKQSSSSNFNSKLISMGTLIDTSNSDVNSRLYNIRDSNGAFVSVAFKGSEEGYDRDSDPDRRRLNSRGREEVSQEKVIRKEKILRDGESAKDSRSHSSGNHNSTISTTSGYGPGPGSGSGSGRMDSYSTSSFPPSPMSRRRNSSANAYLNDVGIMTIDGDESIGLCSNNDIRNESNSNSTKSGISMEDGIAHPNNRNISPTRESTPFRSLSSSPFSQHNSFSTSTDSSLIKSRNSSDNIGWISHATISSNLEGEEEEEEEEVGDGSLGIKFDGNYHDFQPLLNAEYPHPSSNIFHGSKNRYQRSASPATNATMGQLNFNNQSSNNHGSNKDVYINSDVDRSDMLQPHYYPTASHNNFRVQLFGQSPDGLRDYTTDSLRDNGKDYLHQFKDKDKDRFLGSNGVPLGLSIFIAPKNILF